MSDEYIIHNTKTGCLECKHCGFQQAVKMPMAVSDMLTVMDTFQAAHKGCKAPIPEAVLSDYVKGFDHGCDYIIKEIELWEKEVGQDLDVLIRHLKMENKK